MLITPLLLVDCIVALVAVQWIRWLRQGQRTPLPPGPPGYPIIGNALDMLGPEIWEVARKWGNVFGKCTKPPQNLN